MLHIASQLAALEKNMCMRLNLQENIQDQNTASRLLLRSHSWVLKTACRINKAPRIKRSSHTLSVKLLLARELCSVELDKPHQSLWLSTVLLIYYDLGTSNTRSWVRIPVIAHSDKTMHFMSLWKKKKRCINESKCKSKSVKHHLASPHRKLIKQEMTSNSIFNPTSIIMDFLMTLQSESRTIT